MPPTDTATGARSDERDSVWGAGLVALLIVQWSRFLFTSQTFYFRDLSFFSMPLLVETARQWSAGVLPLWNPHLACGVPLAADPNAQAFFPDQLLLVVFGAGISAVKIVLLFRLFLVAIAAYVSLRLVPLRPSSAFLGASLVSLSGSLASLSDLPLHLAGAILFLPLAVAGFRLADGGRRTVVLAALLAALLVFAGSPELALQGAILFAVCAARRGPRGTLLRGIAALAAGVLLAAPLWLPAAVLYPRTPRGLGWTLATPPGFLSFPPARILEFFWPGLLGDPAAPSPEAYWGRGMTDGVTPYLLSVAVGLLPWILMPATLRNPFGRRLALTGAVFLVLSFGKHLPAGELLMRLPGLGSFRYPEKWLIGGTLALAASAAAGFEQLRTDDDRIRRRVVATAGAVFLVSAALLAASWIGPRHSVQGLRWLGLVDPQLPVAAEGAVPRALRRAALESAGVGLVAILLLRGPRRHGIEARLAPLMAALVLGERLPHAIAAVPSVPIGTLQREGADVVAARSAAGDRRFFYDREATTLVDPLRPFAGTLHGLAYAGNSDVDQFSDARSRAFSDAVQQLPFSDGRKIALLRLAEVAVVDTDDPSARSRAELVPISDSLAGRRIYRLEGTPAGRMYFRVVAVDGLADAMRYLLARGFPIDSIGIAEGTESLDRPEARHAVGPLSRPRPDAFRVQVETAGAGLLQLPITFDPNWKIFVDGVLAPVVCVDATFLGLLVKAGVHEVTGVYRDRSLLAGGAVSVLALLLLVLAGGRQTRA